MAPAATRAPENKPDNYCVYEGNTKWWTCDRKGEAIARFAKTGIASEKESPPQTLVEVFQQAVKRNGNKIALRSEMMPALKKGEKPPPPKPLNQWTTWTYQQYYDQSRSFAKALIASGLEQHDAISIFGFNSPEWSISAMGAVLAGGKGSGIYPSDTEDQVQYKTDHSNTVVAIVEDEGKLAKYKAVLDKTPTLRAIVTWGCSPGEDITASDGRVVKTYSFTEFIQFGKQQEDAALNERMTLIKPFHPCILVYTSGTTGRPKAVMLSHDNMVWSSKSIIDVSEVIGKASTEERYISYLPLSHVAGLMIDVISPIVITSNVGKFRSSISVNFARPYDLKTGTLVNRLTTIRPTVFLGVPRVWEKIMERLLAIGASGSSMRKALAKYAKTRALKFTSTRQLGGSAKTPRTMGVANMLLKRIKQRLGLDKCKFMFAGAAPMTRECLEYFGSLNIMINEAYGMSETTAGGTWSTDKYHVWGSIGFESPGFEVKVINKTTGEECPRAKDLFNATEEEQGEICFRGRNVMVGYMANERLGEAHVKEIEEKNAGAMDEYGWLHSGDKGTRDERGMYKITGRYKELIITAGGENIAPVPIEDEIKKLCPYVSNVMMVGNKRKFNVMLITLKTVGATGELPGTEKLDGAAATFSASKTVPQAMEDKAFIDGITAAITQTNSNPAIVPSNAAKVQKFTILPRDFSVQTTELTATLKLKRTVVDELFEPIISKMYEVDTVYVNYSLAPTADLPMGLPAEPVFEKNLSFNVNTALTEAAKEVEKEEAEA